MKTKSALQSIITLIALFAMGYGGFMYRALHDEYFHPTTLLTPKTVSGWKSCSPGAVIYTFEDLLNAIEQVESEGDCNAVGDNGNAVGSFQIWKIYVDDVNRILGHSGFSYNDRLDRVKSMLMAGVYLKTYCKAITVYDLMTQMQRFEAMARIHNAGPDGWRNDPEWLVRNRGYTLEKAQRKIDNSMIYWGKVRAELEKMKGELESKQYSQ